MLLLALFSQISILLYLAWEDWKHRSVPLWSLLLFLAISWFSIHFNWQWADLAFNFCFLFVQFFLLMLYFVLRKYPWRNVLGGMLGWGDVVFILMTASYLSSFWFLASYLLGLIGTLLIVFLTGLYRTENFTIPLISGLAISQGVILVIKYLSFG
jgi:hypothetical protein